MPDAVWETGAAQAVPYWPMMPPAAYAIEAEIDGKKVRVEAPSHDEAVRLWNALAK